MPVDRCPRQSRSTHRFHPYTRPAAARHRRSELPQPLGTSDGGALAHFVAPDLVQMQQVHVQQHQEQTQEHQHPVIQVQVPMPVQGGSSTTDHPPGVLRAPQIRITVRQDLGNALTAWTVVVTLQVSLANEVMTAAVA